MFLSCPVETQNGSLKNAAKGLWGKIKKAMLENFPRVKLTEIQNFKDNGWP